MTVMFAKPVAWMILVGTLGAPAMADAQEQSFGSVGLGFVVAPEYLGADEAEISPVVTGEYGWNGRGVSFDGSAAKLDLLGDTDRWTFAAGPLVGFRHGRDDVEDRAVRALGDIDTAVEVGAFFRVDRLGVLSDTDSLGLAVDYRADVSDAHEGSVGTVSVLYGFMPTEDMAVEVEAGLTFGSGAYMDTYFGVSPAGAATSGLARFDADGGLQSIPLSVSASYAVTEHWHILGFAGLEQLVGDAADSPIVKDRGQASQASGGLAIVYAF